MPSAQTRRKNLVLDLDNTLISAEALTQFPFHQPYIKNKVMHFSIHNMDDYYIVFERPYVQEFLDYVFSQYDVSILTAASKDYMLFIIDRIILKHPGRQLKYIFYDYHCDLSHERFQGTKDLRLLWETFGLDYSPHNTVIIDDLKAVYRTQPDNAIRIHPFNILDPDSEHDTVLKYDIPQQLADVFQHLEHLEQHS